VIVVLESKIYIYNIQNLKMIDVFTTVTNLKGIISVCAQKESCVFAIPDKNEGDVRVVHVDKDNKTTQINAHQTAISALALNFEGTLLASSSDKGTLVRLWDTDSGHQLQEMRRGSDPAEIYYLSFDPLSKWLACSSDKGTIHIFAIKSEIQLAAAKAAEADAAQHEAAQMQAMNQAQNTKSMLSMFKSVLPKYFDSEWSFAQFRVVDMRTICAIFENTIVVASADGNYYMAEIDAKNGGECRKKSERRLIPVEE